MQVKAVTSLQHMKSDISKMSLSVWIDYVNIIKYYMFSHLSIVFAMTSQESLLFTL